MAGFRHIVLLHWAEGTTTDQIDAVHTALEALPPRIAGLQRYEIGRDAGLGAGNADSCVVADFADRAAYEAYAVDEEHLRIISELIKPVLASRHAIQHERS